jgi:hypothetical protein
MSRSFLLKTMMVAGVVSSVGSEASATMLFKGIAVITARTNIASCVQENDALVSFLVEYRANVAPEASPERLSAIGPNGALLLTNNDATPTLRGAGTASISGNAYAVPIVIASVPTNLTITAVTSATTAITIAGTVNNLGIPGCNVSFRGALTLLPPGGF